MNESLLGRAKTVGMTLLRDHAVLPKYSDSLTVLLVGSVAAGFADDLSDVDIWVLCSDEVAASLSEEFRQIGLRFMVPPPNDTSIEDTEAHYFVFPISKLEQALEAWDDESLFLISHSVAVHDPSRQFAALAARFTKLPPNVLRSKIESAYTLSRQRTFSTRDVLRRYQPLAWLQHAVDTAHSALQLCCWLDGQAPTGRKWLMQQAQICSQAPIVLPAVVQFLHAIGPTLVQGSARPCDKLPLLAAATKLDAAACQAVESAGFGDLPRWSPPVSETRQANT